MVEIVRYTSVFFKLRIILHLFPSKSEPKYVLSVTKGWNEGMYTFAIL